MNFFKRLGLLILAVLFSLGMVGILFYLQYVVKDYRITAAFTSVMGVGLLVLMRTKKKNSKY